jgi:DNA-binding response OmpR family regulator
MIEARILVVDDESLNLDILLEFLEGETAFAPHTAENGEAAWRLLQDPANDYKAILLDRMMPELDGIGLLKRIKGEARLAGIPVIMQTAASSAAQIREGLEAGAYYYLTKPYGQDDLLAILHAALSDGQRRDALRRQLHQHISSLHFLNQAEFAIRTVDEASQLASFIAQACPDPETAVIGISELLVNGIEHGNLGLSYAEKAHLKREDSWRAEIDRRSTLPENISKQVQVSLRRQNDDLLLRVADQGEGFDWRSFLEIDPERAFDPNGRGIALARLLSFSSIHYEGCGNIAVATISRSPPISGTCPS